MQQSNPTLLVSKTLLKVWQRKAISLVAGKPHTVALLLPIMIAYGFFAWQARQLITPLASMVNGGTEQASFTVLIASLIFVVITSATWFLAKQTLEVAVPSSLQALPFTNYVWLRAQAVLFVFAMWSLNSLMTVPLFVALGRQQGMNLTPWLTFVELVSLFYILAGLLLYLLFERIVRLTRFRKKYGSLSSLHTIGQVTLVAWVGYQRLFGSTALSRINVGLETRYFINMLSGWRIVLPFILILFLAVIAAWAINSVFKGFESSDPAPRGARPFSAWLLPPQPSKFGTFLVTVWRVVLSDHEVSLPNILIIVIIAVSVLATRLHVFSEAIGLVIYSIYNVLFLLLFSGWAISARGRLGTSRRVVYALPIAPRQFITTLSCITIVSVLVSYVCVELFLMLLFGHMVGETATNIAKNSVMLAAVTTFTFALGAVSYAGQKNKLNQVPIAVGFAIVNILGLALLAWLNGRYGMISLVPVAILCIFAGLVVSMRYEEGHLLDEG